MNIDNSVFESLITDDKTKPNDILQRTKLLIKKSQLFKSYLMENDKKFSKSTNFHADDHASQLTTGTDFKKSHNIKFSTLSCKKGNPTSPSSFYNSNLCNQRMLTSCNNTHGLFESANAWNPNHASSMESQKAFKIPRSSLSQTGGFGEWKRKFQNFNYKEKPQIATFNNPCMMLSTVIEFPTYFQFKEYRNESKSESFQLVKESALSSMLNSLILEKIENYDDELQFSFKKKRQGQQQRLENQPQESLQFTLKSFELVIRNSKNKTVQTLRLPFQLIPIFYSKTDTEFMLLISQLLVKIKSKFEYFLDWTRLKQLLNKIYKDNFKRNNSRQDQKPFKQEEPIQPSYKQYSIDFYDNHKKYILTVEAPKVVIENAVSKSFKPPKQIKSLGKRISLINIGAIQPESTASTNSSKRIIKYLDKDLALFLLHTNFLEWEFEVLNYVASNKIVRHSIFSLYTKYKLNNENNKVVLPDLKVLESDFGYSNAMIITELSERRFRSTSSNLICVSAFNEEFSDEVSAIENEVETIIAEVKTDHYTKHFQPTDAHYFFIIATGVGCIFHKMSSYSVIVEEKAINFSSLKNYINQINFTMHQMKDLTTIKGYYYKMEEFISKILKLNTQTNSIIVDESYFNSNKISTLNFKPEHIKFGLSSYDINYPFLVFNDVEYRVKSVIDPTVSRTIVQDNEMKVEVIKLDNTVLSSLLSTRMENWDKVIIKCFNLFKSPVKHNHSLNSLFGSKDNLNHKRRKNLFSVERELVGHLIKLNRSETKKDSKSSIQHLAAKDINAKKKSHFTKHSEKMTSSY